jgi:oligosaccharide repeat unit polymerase
MIYIIFSFIGLMKKWGKNSLTVFLFSLLVISSISAYLVGRQPSLSLDVSLFVIYNASLLFIIFYSFNKYCELSNIDDSYVNKKKLLIIEKSLTVIGIITFFVNLYIFYNIFSLLVGEIINVQEFKNEGGASTIFSLYVPSYIITYSNLFSPLGYFFLTLHFYYLLKRNIKKSIRYFILSLLIVLSSFLALSRSAATVYILVYFAIFYLIYPIISSKIKKKILIFIIFFFVTIISIFFTLSNTRFSERYTKESLNESIIDNEKDPFLFSIFDYFSQWQENGPIVMKRYKFGSNYWGLYNSCGLAVYIEQKIVNDPNIIHTREKDIYKIMGPIITMFHGNIARLVYDFGFIGTIIFILIYSRIIKGLEPKKNIINFKTLLYLPVILPFCIMFFTGNALSSIHLNIAIIYSIIINLVIRIK